VLNILFQGKKGSEKINLTHIFLISNKNLKMQKIPFLAKKIKPEPQFRFFFAKKLIFLKKRHFNALIYL